MSIPPELAAQLAQLNAAFAAGLSKRLSDIETAMQAFMREPHQRAHLESLHTLLHSLAGSAGTFGFDDLGRRARQFEYRCDPWLNGEAIDPSDVARLPEWFATLRHSDRGLI